MGGLRRRFTGEGCEVAKTCLECPLPVCRFEVNLQTQLMKLRGIKFLKLSHNGFSSNQIAKKVGSNLMPRMIRKVLAQADRDSRTSGIVAYRDHVGLIPFIENILKVHS